MTEQKWLDCINPTAMLEFLRDQASDRKWRLYLCGGCRQIAHLFFRPWSLSAVEVAERFADGQATSEELHRAEWDAEAATFGYELDNERFPHTDPYRMEVLPRLVEIDALPASALTGGEWQVDEAAKRWLLGAAVLADWCASPGLSSYQPRWLPFISDVDWPGRWLADCVFGNPFLPPFIDPRWFAWNDRTIPKLAQSIYDDRAFDRLPSLADGLEEAGCSDAEILAHCRGPGPHVRGCWVVDLLLGKE